MNIDEFIDIDASENIIKVIGVGCGGSNIIDYSHNKSIEHVDFIACDTDKGKLGELSVENIIHLDPERISGLGAGGDPKVGKKAAIASKKTLLNTLKGNTKLLFIVAGMGGGTGTLASSVIADIAKKELGILTIAVVTLPFEWEKGKKEIVALEGLEELEKKVDSIIVLKNENLTKFYPNLGMRKALEMSNESLYNIVKSISNIVSRSYLLTVDFADVEQKLKDSGPALISTTIQKGENRASQGIFKALSNDLLLYNSIKSARRALLLVRQNEESELTMVEISNMLNILKQEVGNDIDIKTAFGFTNEESLEEDEIEITLIASDFENPITDEQIDTKKLVEKTIKPPTKTVKKTPTSSPASKSETEQLSIFDLPSKTHEIYKHFRPFDEKYQSSFKVEEISREYLEKIKIEPAYNRLYWEELERI